MIMLLWTAAAALLTVSAALFLHWADPPPIFNIYRRPGKFFLIKYWIFRLILFVRKHGTKHKTAFDSLRDKDRPLQLSNSPKAFDAVFFTATTTDGFYIVAGCERRKYNIVNGLFYAVVPKLGLLCSHKLPDTVLFDAKEDTFGAEGLLMQPLEPLKKWKVSYTGEMWLHVNPTIQYMVSFVGVFTSNLAAFNFDTDLSPSLVATSIANESWTPHFFNMLRKAHQSHYEQMGKMDARLVIGRKVYTLQNMASLRDHSYGKERDWNLMHRYVFHMIFLDNGTKAVVGVICQPATCSVLQVGYVCFPNGDLFVMDRCDFKLYQHGESGNPPQNYAFRFRAGGRQFTVLVKVEYESEHFVGWNWETRMLERFVSYNMDGIKGRGISEWQYHSARGRPIYASRQDPAWFSEIVAQYSNSL